MVFDINQFLLAVSHTLDFVEKDLTHDITNHGKRVAFVAARIGKVLGSGDEYLSDLISYALLHDCGIATAFQYTNYLEDRSLIESDKNHCIEGERILAPYPFFNAVPDVILYHHEHYDGTGPFRVRGDDIPFYARIIALSDFVAIRVSKGIDSDKIRDHVSAAADSHLDPGLVEIFKMLSANIEFWIEMNDMCIDDAVEKLMPRAKIGTTYEQVRTIAQIFSNIVDDKSPFTGTHTKGISQKTGILCQHYNYSEEEYWKMRIAAELHDLGKLMVPNDILNKPGKLEPDEFKTIQSHTFYTRKILEKIRGFEDITNWASNHHEKLNGQGYPYGMRDQELDRNSRILCCIDIYQALIEDRPYRSSLTHDECIKIMRKMADGYFIDKTIVGDIDAVFGCRLGAQARKR